MFSSLSFGEIGGGGGVRYLLLRVSSLLELFESV